MQSDYCDFCSSTSPIWKYPAKAFNVDGVPARSLDDWVACEDCHTLIEANNRDGLAARFKLTPTFKLLEPFGEQRIKQAQEWVKGMQAQFFAARTGKCYKYTQ